jgi:NADH:ubiquinone oxidoreductase subunit F (NADH-binding)/(2Fe-2S) ferredoxin/NAD-dependent dihydropyrimidine dehydrogenase PreA subunit
VTARLADPRALARYREALAAARSARKGVLAVCVGTGCRANGAIALHEALRAAVEARGIAREIEARATGCQGFCQGGPLVLLLPEGIVYEHVRLEDVSEIVERTLVGGELVERLLCVDPATDLRCRKEEEIPFYRDQQRLLLRDNGLLDPTSIDDYIALGGYAALARALEMGPAAILEEVKRSGLRGRGGAGFPTGRKWEACRRSAGDLKYVVCNADEGDPGAFMDDALLEGNPHSVLEGMIIGALAMGAREGHVYVRQEYPVAVERITRAVSQARELGLLGEAILGSELCFDLRVSRGGGAFVCGEASAMMASLEGRRGVPRRRLIHLSEKGLWGRPTNLNNVETWANVPHIVLKGADWFSSIGTEGSTGTKIFSLVGKVNNTGLVEVPMGTTLREIVFGAGGGVPDGKAFKAVQTGGPSGGCLPADKLDVPVDFDTLEAEGSMMGSGGMIVMDEDTCMVDVARYFLRFLASESCGNCTSCRDGLALLHELLGDITEGLGTRETIALVEELADTVEATSLCALGTSAVNPVLSTLRYFRDEYLAHVDEKRCPAGVCKALISFTIDAERCNGCMLCALRCPQDAVAGEKKQPHTIDQELCIKCGICKDVCKRDAVLVQ